MSAKHDAPKIAALGLSADDARLVASIRKAADDGRRGLAARHDPNYTAMVEGRQGANLACDGKARFSCLAHARKAADDCGTKYATTFYPYLCRYCDGYHFSSHPLRTR